jgi:hypothetical protein
MTDTPHEELLAFVRASRAWKMFRAEVEEKNETQILGLVHFFVNLKIVCTTEQMWAKVSEWLLYAYIS